MLDQPASSESHCKTVFINQWVYVSYLILTIFRVNLISPAKIREPIFVGLHEKLERKGSKFCDFVSVTGLAPYYKEPLS